MTSKPMEDYFADAVDRLLNGEPLERIVTNYPAELRTELQALLAVVELAERTATFAPPQRVPLNRIAARVVFSQRAAELRAELKASSPSAAPPYTASPSSSATPKTTSQPGRLQQLWRDLSEAWRSAGAPAPLMRLAPLTLLLLALYISTFTIVAAAEAALPGDLAYPMKSWIREQRVATAPTEQQATERWLADRAQAKDVATRAGQLQSLPDADPLTAVSILQFRGFDGDQLLVGDLKVIPWHRPEGAGEDEWLPITIDGELEPGAVVMLRYQIVPGASDAVQGMALRVMQAPPMPTPLPTATPAVSNRCQRVQAPNWVTYIVKQGETLSEIAARSQASVAELRRVNCLTDGILRAGTTIFAPANIVGDLPPAPPPVVVTAIATQAPATAAPVIPTSTPSPPTSAPTVTPEPTEAQGGDADPLTPTAVVTPTQAGTPDAIVSPTAPPVVTLTQAATPETAVSPTMTLTATPNATPTATPTVGIPVEPTVTSTQESAPGATASSTPTQVATLESATATPSPGATAPVDAATATSTATATAVSPTSTAPPAPTATQEPLSTTVAPTSAEPATAAQSTVAPTPIPPPPTPTLPPPTATPTAAAPPTAMLPTAIPAASAALPTVSDNPVAEP